jgi:MerR family transcriptional regulator/heat shock protein HspR
MARKRSEIEPMRPDLPIYPIGVAARLLNVHPRTLRIYEDEGLIKPAHKGTRRMFSANDIKWIECLRSAIHDDGISIPGLKKLLSLVPCHEITNCPAEICESCTAKIDWAVPRTLHQVGDEAAAQAAKKADRKKRKAGSSQKKKAEVIWLNIYPARTGTDSSQGQEKISFG